MTPERYLGTVMELCRERRGVDTTFNYLAAGRMEVVSQLPLAEVLFDFYDRLKSIHREFSHPRALRYCQRLAKTIPRQQFKIAIQGAIGGQIIARTTINPFRKDVTAKCYGGDITRKRKLLEKQKEGKKRMKAVGSVEVPQEAFLAILKIDED